MKELHLDKCKKIIIILFDQIHIVPNFLSGAPRKKQEFLQQLHKGIKGVHGFVFLLHFACSSRNKTTAGV